MHKKMATLALLLAGCAQETAYRPSEQPAPQPAMPKETFDGREYAQRAHYAYLEAKQCKDPRQLFPIAVRADRDFMMAFADPKCNEDPLLHMEHGIMRLSMRDYDFAAASFAHVISKWPDNKDAYKNWAFAKLLTGKSSTILDDVSKHELSIESVLDGLVNASDNWHSQWYGQPAFDCAGNTTNLFQRLAEREYASWKQELQFQPAEKKIADPRFSRSLRFQAIAAASTYGTLRDQGKAPDEARRAATDVLNAMRTALECELEDTLAPTDSILSEVLKPYRFNGKDELLK